MGRFRSRTEGFRARKCHWICRACGTLFTVDKPNLCTHCHNEAREYIYFPSAKEYNRYQVLRMMELAGKIDAGSIELQPCYEVTMTEKVYLDFRYTVDGKTVVEDAKTSGTDTRQSKRKRKALKEQHGIDVVLV